MKQTTGHRAPPASTRDDPVWGRDFEAILKAYEQAGGNPGTLRSPRIASLVVSGNQVLGANQVPGLEIETEPLPEGVRARIAIAPNTTLEHPIHLCFGMIPARGTQHIISAFDIGAGARVQILAHCTFPNALDLRHLMDAHIYVGPRAHFTYTEAHYHGPHGGIHVIPRAKIVVDEEACYLSTFSLVHGRVGILDMDYFADVAAQGVVEMTTHAYGSGEDDITVRETVRLNGTKARGLAKARIAVRERARSRVFTTAEGNAPFALGHMDCTEIVCDEAVAENQPRVVVRHDSAQITHEAAIGRVNRKEMETLMARGLDEDTAVDLLIHGMLRG